MKNSNTEAITLYEKCGYHFLRDVNYGRFMKKQISDALLRFQEQMRGEADNAGFISEEDVDEWISASRREDNA